MDTKIKTPEIEAPQPWDRRRGTWPRRLLAVTAVAALATAVALTGGSPPRSAAPTAVTVAGLVAERTELVALEPGAARTWPAGPGVQGFTVLSGRVSVHGPTGDRTEYQSGQGFAAGWEPYRTVNETDSPIELLVTFQTPP